MKRLFWPTELKNSSTLVVRLARVIHWAGAIVGAFVTLLALAYALDSARTNSVIDWGAVFGALIIALAVYAFTRGVRYILASE